MSKSAVYIHNFKVLYNIIFEIKNLFNFDLFENENEQSILKEQKKRVDKSFIVITQDKLNNNYINNKQIIMLESYPLNLLSLIEKINSNLEYHLNKHILKELKYTILSFKYMG